MQISRILFAATMLLGPIAFVGQSNAESDEKLRPIIVLNHLHASLARIAHDHSRVTLEYEYGQIFNNINLSEIDDLEIVEAALDLADALSSLRLNDRERDHLRALNLKQTNALISKSVSGIDREKAFDSIMLATSIMNIAGAGAAFAAGGPAILLALTPAAIELASGYILPAEATPLDEGSWELDTKEIEQLHRIRSRFLLTYWKILRRYDLDDRYRVTEKQFDELATALADTDPARRQRRLETFMPQAAAYPLIAFYAAAAAEEAGDQKSASVYFGAFAENWCPILRQDDIYAAGLMALARLNNGDADQETVEAVLRHGDDQAAARLFGALALVQLGEPARAEKILRISIDRDLAPAESRRALAALLAGSNVASFQDLVRRLAKDEKENILEAASLAAFAKDPDPDVLEQLAQTLSTATLNYSEGVIYDDTLELTIPTRVAVAYDAVGELALDIPDARLEGDLNVGSDVKVEFPYEIGEGVSTLTVPVSIKFPSLRTQLVFKGNRTMEHDESWQSRATETAGAVISGSATVGAEAVHRATEWWTGKAPPPEPVPEEPASAPTKPVWRFELTTIKGDGFCFKPLAEDAGSLRRMMVCQPDFSP